MISWRMAAAWVVALVLATVLTWQIVGLADSQVGDEPVAVAPTFSATSTTTGSSTSSSQMSSSTSSTTSPRPTTTSTSATTSSSSQSSTSSSTSSSVASAPWSVRTINTIGGSVVVRHRPNEVELQAATPAPGFVAEVDDSGPPRVRVEFESEVADVRVEVSWADGSLDVDIDEDD